MRFQPTVTSLESRSNPSGGTDFPALEYDYVPGQINPPAPPAPAPAPATPPAGEYDYVPAMLVVTPA